MRSASAPIRRAELLADMRMRLGDVVDGRRQSGADRPDRLIGDDHRSSCVAAAAPSRRSGATGLRASRRFRARRASRRCRRSRSARPAMPPRPWPARSASVSPWSVRRSEWPTITMRGAGILQHLGRNVAGMRARFLPVAILAAALDRRARQDFVTRATAAWPARKCSASVSASRPPMKPWPIASSSSSDALVPFIFQLPATSGRMAEVIGRLPSRQRRSDAGFTTKIGPQSNRQWRPRRALLPIDYIRQRATKTNADARNRNETCSTHFARPPVPGSPNFCSSCWSSASRSGAFPGK